MARPQKKGLDYFPLEVNGLRDVKIRTIIRKFDAIGFLFYHYLICWIFETEGYYLEYNEDFELIAAADTNTEINDLKNILDEMIRLKIFDDRIFFEKGILTSSDVQKKYQLAVKTRGLKRKVKVDKSIWLLNESETEKYMCFENDENPDRENKKTGAGNSLSGNTRDSSKKNISLSKENTRVSGEEYTNKKKSKVNESKVNIKENKSKSPSVYGYRGGGNPPAQNPEKGGIEKAVKWESSPVSDNIEESLRDKAFESEIGSEHKCADKKESGNIDSHNSGFKKESENFVFITLTEAEYLALLKEFGKDTADEYIDRLNDYKGASGAKYNSDFYTLRRWIKKDRQSGNNGVSKPPESPPPPPVKQPRYESRAEYDFKKIIDTSWEIIDKTLEENKKQLGENPEPDTG